MSDGPDHTSASARARWLAELALAIDQARRAAEHYEFAEDDALEVRALKARLEAIRLEVDELRRGGWRSGGEELGSKRINLRPDEG
jgi:hypothetical protein